MKLELKHLAPYLPYRLKVWHKNHNINSYHTMNATWGDNQQSINDLISDAGSSEYYKPILRPLSDLTEKQVREFYEFEGEQHMELKEWKGMLIDEFITNNPFQLRQFNLLFKWHFDVFGLIEKGLAIDINTLKQD